MTDKDKLADAFERHVFRQSLKLRSKLTDEEILEKEMSFIYELNKLCDKHKIMIGGLNDQFNLTHIADYEHPGYEHPLDFTKDIDFSKLNLPKIEGMIEFNLEYDE